MAKGEGGLGGLGGGSQVCVYITQVEEEGVATDIDSSGRGRGRGRFKFNQLKTNTFRVVWQRGSG